MMMGGWAVALNFLSMAVFAGLLSASFALCLLPVLKQASYRLSPRQQKRLIQVWAMIPWLAGLGMLLIGFTTQVAFSAFVEEGIGLLHWHHVDWFNLASWQGLVLIGGLGWLVARCGYFAYTSYRTIRLQRQLAQLAKPVLGHAQLRVLPTQDIIAITYGFWSPVIVLSEGLLQQSTAAQKDIILAHEQAHILSRDNLTRWGILAACCYLPKRWVAPVFAQYTLVTEQLADQYAARIADKTEVAKTLVWVAKRQLNDQNALCAAFFSTRTLEQRIAQLLTPTPASGAWMSLGAGVAGGVLLLSIGLLDALHHLLDTVFYSII